MDVSLSHGLENLAERLSALVHQITFFGNLGDRERNVLQILVVKAQEMLRTSRDNRLKLEGMCATAKLNGHPITLQEEALMCSRLRQQAEAAIEASELIIKVICSLFPNQRKGSTISSQGPSVIGQRSELIRCEKLLADGVQIQTEANELARSARHNATLTELKSRIHKHNSPPAENNQVQEDVVDTKPEELTHVVDYVIPNNQSQVVDVEIPPMSKMEVSQGVTKASLPTPSNLPLNSKEIKEKDSCCSCKAILLTLLLLLILLGGGGAAVYFFVLK